jgi:hypothetical protein
MAAFPLPPEGAAHLGECQVTCLLAGSDGLPAFVVFRLGRGKLWSVAAANRRRRKRRCGNRPPLAKGRPVRACYGGASVVFSLPLHIRCPKTHK